MQKVVAFSKFYQSYECNCQICYQEFNTEDKRPYIICANQHVSCMKCLKQYLQKHSEKERPSCHFCRQQIVQNKLIELRPLLTLLQKVKIQKQQNEFLIDKFNNINQWKKNEVNQILERMTTILIYKIQESDKNNTNKMDEIKEQIREKTNNYQAQSQSFFEQMRICIRNIEIRNQQILEQTRQVVSQSKKQGQQIKELISKLQKRNTQIFRNQDQQKGKTNKIITQLQNLNYQTNQVVKSSAKLNEKFNQQKRNLIIQKKQDQQKQKTVQKKKSLENVSMKIGNIKQKTDEQLDNNKNSKGEQNHRTIRSYTTALLSSPISIVEGQHLDPKRDFKKQKKVNPPTKEEVKQKNHNKQINVDSKKLNKKQVDAFLSKAVVSEKYQQLPIKSAKKLPNQSKEIYRKMTIPPRQQSKSKDDQQKQIKTLQKKHKVEWKRQLQLNFQNNEEQDPINNLRQSTMLPTSAKNSYDNKIDQTQSFRRSFGNQHLSSVRNHSYNNKKQVKLDIFDQVQKQRKNKFISSIMEIYGKANKQQYQKFYQRYPLKNKEELIQLWIEKNEIDSKKKVNKLAKLFQY